MILLVVLAHLAIAKVDSLGVFNCFMWQNVAVAVFFFISGYGRMCALKERTGYLEGLVLRTVRKLFVPLLILLSLSIVHWAVAGGGDVGGMFAAWRRGDTVLIPHGWYIIVLLLLTEVFSILARNVSEICLLIGMPIAVFVIGVIFKCGFHWPRWWWLSLHAYPIGMLYYYYENRTRHFLKGNPWIYVLVGSCFCVVCVLNGMFQSNVIEGIMRALIGPVVVLGFYALPISQKCRSLSFLGVISLELYLCHGVVRQWMLNVAPDGWHTTFGLMSVVVAVLVAWMLHEVDGKINSRGYEHA